MRIQTSTGIMCATAALLVGGASVLSAEEKCDEFRGVMQYKLGPATIQTPSGPGETYTWLGPTYVRVGAEEKLVTVTDFSDAGGPEPEATSIAGWVVERGVRMKFDFGNGDTLTFEIVTGAFEDSMDKVVYSKYYGVMEVIDGTGKYKGAYGVVLQIGPYVVWFTSPDLPPEGRYNGELIGRVCTGGQAAAALKNSAAMKAHTFGRLKAR